MKKGKIEKPGGVLRQLNNTVAELDDVFIECTIESTFMKASTFKFDYKARKGSWKNVPNK